MTLTDVLIGKWDLKVSERKGNRIKIKAVISKYKPGMPLVFSKWYSRDYVIDLIKVVSGEKASDEFVNKWRLY